MKGILTNKKGYTIVLLSIFLLTALLPVAAQAADSISLSDIVMAAKLMRSSESPTQEEIKKYDLTGDGRLTLSDVIAMARSYADSKPDTVQKPVDENNTPVTVDDDAMAAEVCRLIIDGINDTRAKKGIGPLPINEDVTLICQAQLNELLPNRDGGLDDTALQEAAEAAVIDLHKIWRTGMDYHNFVPGHYSNAAEVMNAFNAQFLQTKAYNLEHPMENQEGAMDWAALSDIYDEISYYIPENAGAFGVVAGCDELGWHYYLSAYWNE